MSLSPLDQSKGHRLAAKNDLTTWGIMLHHNACGQRVSRNYDDSLKCVCGVQWKEEVVRKMDDDGAATRFHVRGSVDTDTYVLVERFDQFAKRTYTSVVKQSEADQLKLKKAVLP